jgi:hypothetical protein
LRALLERRKCAQKTPSEDQHPVNAKPSKTAAEPEAKPEPGPRAKARAIDAKRRFESRPARVRVSYETVKPGTVSVGPPHSDAEGFRDSLYDALGTSSDDFARRELQRLGETLRGNGDASPAQLQDDVNAALAVVDGIRPENEIEAMLAEQMAATHVLAMKELGHLRRSENIAQHDSHGSMAVKLLRTFTMQTEALAKLKRGGEQVVRVEHVNVFPGGQAIIGAVSAQRGEGGVSDGKWRQADGPIDPRALAFAPGAEVFGEDPGRDAVPASCSEGQKALPDARGSARKRRAQGRA